MSHRNNTFYHVESYFWLKSSKLMSETRKYISIKLLLTFLQLSFITLLKSYLRGILPVRQVTSLYKNRKKKKATEVEGKTRSNC